MACLADADAHEVFDVRRFGEGAEVESDDGFFEPLGVWSVTVAESGVVMRELGFDLIKNSSQKV